MFRHININEREDYVFLELEGGNLELIQKLDDTPFGKPKLSAPYCPHLALVTENMDETLALFSQHAIPIIKGPLEIEGEERWVYICDPDNNVIEFIQWLG